MEGGGGGEVGVVVVMVVGEGTKQAAQFCATAFSVEG